MFTGLSADALGNLSVTVQNTSGGGGYYPLNAIVLEAVGAVIPEPSTLAIWSLGLLGLIGWRRRK